MNIDRDMVMYAYNELKNKGTLVYLFGYLRGHCFPGRFSEENARVLFFLFVVFLFVPLFRFVDSKNHVLRSRVLVKVPMLLFF